MLPFLRRTRGATVRTAPGHQMRSSDIRQNPAVRSMAENWIPDEGIAQMPRRVQAGQLAPGILRATPDAPIGLPGYSYIGANQTLYPNQRLQSVYNRTSAELPLGEDVFTGAAQTPSVDPRRLQQSPVMSEVYVRGDTLRYGANPEVAESLTAPYIQRDPRLSGVMDRVRAPYADPEFGITGRRGLMADRQRTYESDYGLRRNQDAAMAPDPFTGIDFDPEPTDPYLLREMEYGNRQAAPPSIFPALRRTSEAPASHLAPDGGTQIVSSSLRVSNPSAAPTGMEPATLPRRTAAVTLPYLSAGENFRGGLPGQTYLASTGNFYPNSRLIDTHQRLSIPKTAGQVIHESQRTVGAVGPMGDVSFKVYYPETGWDFMSPAEQGITGATPPPSSELRGLARSLRQSVTSNPGVYTNTPMGGQAGSRADAYRRMGFVDTASFDQKQVFDNRRFGNMPGVADMYVSVDPLVYGANEAATMARPYRERFPAINRSQQLRLAPQDTGSGDSLPMDWWATDGGGDWEVID